ncbi:hypothetical protein EYF80_000869 [Liparis tanakae]|uniref:Uncharacterized protein n=1 Tax=Liparis tanakae TaxID=230148 RepID=A0A4Z2JG95_9TELE|nr:hypothetical protein EYF80_000869 [Liparis tanakae]
MQVTLSLAGQLPEFQQGSFQPTDLLTTVCSQLLLATGAFPGRGPAWPSHVKCGPRVSEDMPSATWAPANSAEPRWEQLGLERRVQVQRGGERGIRKREEGDGRRERERERDMGGRPVGDPTPQRSAQGVNELFTEICRLLGQEARESPIQIPTQDAGDPAPPRDRRSRRKAGSAMGRPEESIPGLLLMSTLGERGAGLGRTLSSSALAAVECWAFLMLVPSASHTCSPRVSCTVKI